ncbi:Uncharacterised protein [Brucella anthropi]|nr:Uncharacterised protein [Brucella anthropi]
MFQLGFEPDGFCVLCFSNIKKTNLRETGQKTGVEIKVGNPGQRIVIRFVLRSFAVVFLALAVIFAVLDGARSVGASQFIAKPLFSMWSRNAPETLADAETFVTHYIGAGVWNAVCIPLLERPGWLLFGILALLFYAIGHRRERPLGRFTAR